MTRYGLQWLVVVPFALLSCGEDPYVEVVLQPDPNLSTREQLAERVDSLVFILDSDDGLYQPGDELSQAELQIKDADGDPSDLELVVNVPVIDGVLPRVRIERGGLPEGPINIRVLGVPLEGDGSPIASGTLMGMRFDDGSEISLPFDFVDTVLPPRVIEVFPADGSTVGGCELGALTVLFSRPLDEETLAAEYFTIPGAEVTSVALDDTGRVATLSVTGLTGAQSLTFDLAVAGVTDLDGEELDQAPKDAAKQPYRGDFSMSCAPPPLVPAEPCGEIFCTVAPNIACLEEQCVLTGCAASCSGDTVCDPLRAACVPDCRVGGVEAACFGEEVCSADTGLCGA